MARVILYENQPPAEGPVVRLQHHPTRCLCPCRTNQHFCVAEISSVTGRSLTTQIAIGYGGAVLSAIVVCPWRW